MHSIMVFAVSYAINSAWQVPISAAAGWLASRLLTRIGARAQHRAWVISFALAVLLPACCLLPHAAAGVRGAHSGHVVSILFGETGTMPSTAHSHMLVRMVVLAIFLGYGCVLLYFLGRFAWSLYGTSSLLRGAGPVLLDEHTTALWQRCTQTLDVKNARLLSSPHISGPITAGIWPPTVLVPLDFVEECSAGQLLVAMGHECAHIHRHDFSKNLLYQAAGILIAYHPAARYLQSQVAQTRELVCDRMAASLLPDSQHYAHSLLSLAARITTQPPHPSSYAIGTFDAGILEKRIMLIQIKARPAGIPLCCVLTSAVALLFACAAVAGASSAISLDTPQSTAVANSTGPVYRPGGKVTNPKLIYSTDPSFPEGFRTKGRKFQGVCVLKVIVTKEGKPADIHVVRSLTPAFDQKAIEATEQYRFQPATRLGKPVAVQIMIEVNFQLF